MPSVSIYVPADYRKADRTIVEERASLARLAPPAICISPRKFNKKKARQSLGGDCLAKNNNEQQLNAPNNGTTQG